MNHAAHEWPISAMPSIVTGSGASYSSIWTPRARRSAMGSSKVGHAPGHLRLGIRCADGAHRDDQLGPSPAPEHEPIAFVFAEEFEPERVAVEDSTCRQVGRKKDRKHRVIAEHRSHSSCMTRADANLSKSWSAAKSAIGRS